MKKTLSILLMLVLCLTIVPINAGAMVKNNTTSITLNVGKNTTLEIHSTKGKKLTDLVAYLKKKKLISGKGTKMEASMIGAKSGIKYSGVELYEYNTNSKAYKALVKSKKVELKDFNMTITVSAINGKFIILCEDAKNKSKIIKAFKNFK